MGSDYVEQAFDINGLLATVNQPVCCLPPAFRYDNIIYCYLEQWANAGQIKYVVSSPEVFTTDSTLMHASSSKFAYCTSDQVFILHSGFYTAATGQGTRAVCEVGISMLVTTGLRQLVTPALNNILKCTRT